MLDLWTLWLMLPEDRYEATPSWRGAERALYRLLRGSGSCPESPRPARPVAGR